MHAIWPKGYQSVSLEKSHQQGMVWNGMENGIEWKGKFRYGIWKMPVWNGMKNFKNGIEDNLPYFHTNSILDFEHGFYRQIYTVRVVITKTM